jgi:plastocyanin
MRKLVSVLAVLSIALGFVACGDDDDDDPTVADTEESSDAGGDAIEITISGSQFDPTEVEAAAGDATFSVSNEDGFAHTFTADDLGVDEEIDGGASASVTATLEAGSYEFRCKIHPSMTGTITVS